MGTLLSGEKGENPGEGGGRCMLNRPEGRKIFLGKSPIKQVRNGNEAIFLRLVFS